MDKIYRVTIWHETIEGDGEPIRERDFTDEAAAREEYAYAVERIASDYEHDREHGHIWYKDLPRVRYCADLAMIPLDEDGEPVDSMDWDDIEAASYGYEESEAKAEQDWRERQREEGYVINYWDNPVKFEACVPLMDDELREQVHTELAPCTDQEFFDRYCKLHVHKFGDEFEPNKVNPQW